MKLKEKLEKFQDKEIVVVMNDGWCFKGRLDDFDKEVLILSDVSETTNEEVDWRQIDLKGETKEGKADKKCAEGYVIWRHVALPEVIIRIAMVSRIWPYEILEKTKAEKKPDTTPVYLKYGVTWG